MYDVHRDLVESNITDTFGDIINNEKKGFNHIHTGALSQSYINNVVDTIVHTKKMGIAGRSVIMIEQQSGNQLYFETKGSEAYLVAPVREKYDFGVGLRGFWYSWNGLSTPKKTIIIPGEIQFNRKTYTVTKLSKHVFRDCKEIESVLIPDSIHTIESVAFMDSGIISIKLPIGITILEDGVFYGCNRLQNVILPIALQKIESTAFEGVNMLNEIIIPASIESISVEIFGNTTISRPKLVMDGEPPIIDGYKCDFINEIKEWNVEVNPIYLPKYKANEHWRLTKLVKKKMR